METKQKMQTFKNNSLWCIFNIIWHEKIRNEELWQWAGQEPVHKQILRRNWCWIGHTHEETNIQHQTITVLEPAGKETQEQS